MNKIILMLTICLTLVLNAQEQTQDKKNRLLAVVQILGYSCGSVESYTELSGWGGSNGSISIYCSNGTNYSLKKDYSSSYGYKLEVR